MKKGKKVTILDEGKILKGVIAEIKGDLVYINIPSFIPGVPMQVVRTKGDLRKFNKL